MNALVVGDARSARRPFGRPQRSPAGRRRLVSEPALDRAAEVSPAHPHRHVFSVFRAGVRSADLRPLGTYLVDAIETELRAEDLPTDTFSELQPDSVRLAKTASRSTLGFMTEMAFELRYVIADRGRPRPMRHRRPQPRTSSHATQPRRIRPPDRTRRATRRGAYLTGCNPAAGCTTAQPGQPTRVPSVSSHPRNPSASVCEPYGGFKTRVPPERAAALLHDHLSATVSRVSKHMGGL